MDAPFKLLIYAVAAVFLLFFVSVFFFNQCFWWCPDPVGEMSDLLKLSELKLGTAVGREIEFPRGLGIKAGVFDSPSRSVVFQCNNFSICCPKKAEGIFPAECSKKINWDERSLAVASEGGIHVFSRCRFEELFICTLFFGKKPAQLELEVSFPKSLNLESSQDLEGFLEITNSGGEPSLVVDIFFNLNLIKTEGNEVVRHFKGEKHYTLFPETGEEVFPLQPGKTQTAPASIEVAEPGSFELEILVVERNDPTNFAKKTVTFEATGEIFASECEAVEHGAERFWLEEEDCYIIHECSGCKFEFECREAWQNKGVSVHPAKGDKTHAVEIVNKSDPRCS